jgi:hemerythrin-like domain-containing protein
MPVILGARPEHGFDQPLGLLSDCHRRIEGFLGMMIRVVERSDGGRTPLADEERSALEAALRYFKTAAPRHTQDEELSLFPRLRQSDNPDAHTALVRVESLEDDHRRTETMHAQADRLCRRWLDGGSIAKADAETLHQLLHDLRAIYARHIDLEDKELFPLAARVLHASQIAQIGIEMAQRRGLPAGGSKS